MSQKTILALVQATASELNLPSPTTALSNQDQNVQKLVSLTRAVCDDLLMEFDWQVLQTRYSFTTVSGQESYPMPADRERWINGTFFDANNKWAMQGPKTPTEWEWAKASNVVSFPFTQFRVYNDKFYVSPTPGTTAYTFNMEYVSNYYVKSSGGVTQADFLADSDICLFDHRVVIYGIKLKLRESIAMDTTAALADYRRALEFAKGQDVPAGRLSLLGSTGYRMLTTANIPDGSWS